MPLPGQGGYLTRQFYQSPGISMLADCALVSGVRDRLAFLIVFQVIPDFFDQIVAIHINDEFSVNLEMPLQVFGIVAELKPATAANLKMTRFELLRGFGRLQGVSDRLA